MVRFRKLRGQQQEEEAPPPEPEEDEEPLIPEEAEADADEEEPDELDDLGIEDEDPDEDLEAAEDDLSEDAGAEDLGSGGDTALKELAARMAVLQSNLESVQNTRGSLEDKLAKMEDRMLRLGSLAEAVSSEYNPFIAENSPDEPHWQEGQAPAAAEGAAQAPPEPAREAAQPPPDPAPEPEPEPAPQQPPEATAQAQRPEPEDEMDLDEAIESLGGKAPKEELSPAEAMEDVGERMGIRKAPRTNLEENFMLLEWVGLMLRRVGRANLLDLLEYYEGLDWLDPQTKKRVIRVAVGIDAPATTGDNEWRGDLDLHERSLITIERLHGNEITAADVESLRMDMRRFFGE